MTLKQSSLQRVFLLPFVVLMLCLAATIGWVLYRAGEDATDALARKSLIDMMSGLIRSTERHLLSSELVLNAIAPESIMMGDGKKVIVLPFDPSLATVEDRLWIATGLFPDVINLAYFGGDDGRFVSVRRIVNKSLVEVRTREPGADVSHVRDMAGPRNPISILRSDQFDARLRPWYKSAVLRHRPNWSSVYIDFSTREPLLTLAKPIFTADHSLVGVVATDMSLRQLTGFLQNLALSEKGVAFIVERSGVLVATSTPELPYTVDGSKLTRINANDSTVPLVRNAYREVEQRLKSGAPLAPGPMREASDIAGKVMMTASSLKDDSGLDWIAVIAVPRSEFRGTVTDALYQSLAIGMVAVLISLVVGTLILKWVLRDIRKLTVAAKGIGSGDPFQVLDIDRGDEIGQLAQSFQEMEHNLRTDRLTGVFNRDSLIAQIDFRCANVSDANPLRFALLFIDLDSFKPINDKHGHESGDRVLIEVAKRLQLAIRRDDAVARFGGDEFVIYLHGIDRDDVLDSIKEKIRRVIEQPIDLASAIAVQVGASVGAARFPTDGLDSEALFRIADMRMFDVKRGRKSGVKNRVND